MSKVQVKIMGSIYELEVDGSEELFIHSVAQYLEKKMEKVQEAGIVDTQKIAVLAALNIADELLKLKDSRETNSGVLDKKADELIKVLDSSISA
ncbi:cell division protein ZapA [Elusimicrobiota bacterium]